MSPNVALVFGVLLPAIIVAIAAMIPAFLSAHAAPGSGGGVRSFAHPRLLGVVLPIALALGTSVMSVAVRGWPRVAWPLDSVPVTDRLVYVAWISAAAGVLVGAVLRARSAVVAIALLAAMWLVVSSRQSFGAREQWGWIGALSAGGVVVWWLLDWLSQRGDIEARVGVPVSLGVAIGLGAPTLLMWAQAFGAQLSGALGCMLLATCVVAWVRRSQPLGCTALAMMVIVVWSLWWSGFLMGDEPPLASAVLLGLSPLGALAMRASLVRKRRAWVRVAVGATLTAIVAGVAVVIAVRSAPIDDYASGATGAEEPRVAQVLM